MQPCPTRVTDRTGEVLHSCDNPDWSHDGDHHDPATGQFWYIDMDSSPAWQIVVRGGA